ncbi:hypothetical protein SEVIR_2G301650v4 [Setaria viridis]
MNRPSFEIDQYFWGKIYQKLSTCLVTNVPVRPHRNASSRRPRTAAARRPPPEQHVMADADGEDAWKCARSWRRRSQAAAGCPGHHRAPPPSRRSAAGTAPEAAARWPAGRRRAAACPWRSTAMAGRRSRSNAQARLVHGV